MAEKTNKLTIHLIRSEVGDDEIIKPGVASAPMEVGTLYGANSHAATPSWFSDFFGAATPSPFVFLSASYRCVLIVKSMVGKAGEETERTFALTFGHGRHLLNDGVCEERFGLKVVLNTMVEDGFRSVDRTTLGSIPKQSREQMSREGAVSGFGLDIDQDLVRAITARSGSKAFGSMISGRDALSISAKFDASDIHELLALCMDQFDSKAYVDRGYDWIDQIRDVREPTLVSTLNADLVKRLDDRELQSVWMAPPDIVDWVAIKGFKYQGGKKATVYDDLDVTTFLDTLGDADVTLDILKEKSVMSVAAKNDEIDARWQAYRCLYAESEMVDHQGETRSYVLHNGRWYEIAKTFADEIKADFAAIPDAALPLLNYEHSNENEYNKAAATDLGACCMDCQTVQHGGGHSKIEFCDILTGDGKLVHVKRYSGSAQLSHLFAQGAVSGELFVQDVQFREKLNEKLPEGHKLEDPASQPDAKDFEVIFAIVSEEDALDIPFFSKVSLRNARRRLAGYGYKVSKKHIIVTKAS